MIIYQLLNLILKNRLGIYKQNGDALVNFDTITNMEVTAEVEVPEFPVEDGSFSNDARYKKPVMISVTGVKSQKLSLFNPNFENELENDIAIIKAAKDGLDLFTVYNKFDVYENMTITGFSYSHTAETLNSLAATLELKQVRITEAQYFNLGSVKNPSAANTKNIGKVQEKPVEEKTKSFIKKMYEKRGKK